MKRIICAAMAVVIAVCAFAGCGSEKKSAKKSRVKPYQYSGKFTVGFSRQDITPDHAVPLSGYGNSDKRMSEDLFDRLYFDCIAVSDGDNNTLLFMCVDNVAYPQQSAETTRQLIESATGVPASNIYIISTHSHSTPDMGIGAKVGYINVYNTMVYTQAVNAAVNALNDRAPSKIYRGETEATGISFVRHYRTADGGIASDNHDTRTDSSIPLVSHCTDVDPTLFFLKFVREGKDKKDIIYTNWRAHGQMVGGNSFYSISSDWVGPFRDAVEKEYDCYCAYFQGCAGNINPKTRMTNEGGYIDHRDEGNALAKYLLDAIDNTVEVKAGEVKAKVIKLTANVNHSKDSLVGIATLEANDWKQNNSTSSANAIGLKYGIFSPYHAERIVTNATLPKSDTFEVQAASIGEDLGFTFAPCELFDTNGCWIIDNSPYKYTFVQAYTNGVFGYLPSEGAFDYQCYETDITKYERGTAEKVASTLVDQLKKFKKG